MTETPAHHTAEHWAQRRRSIADFIVKRVQDHGDTVALTGHLGWTFAKSRAELGRDIRVGEHLQQETIGFTQVTGLRDADGWLFHYTDQELADEAREFSEGMRRREVEQLERHRKTWATQEAALPDWLGARIQRFRDAAGEKFLLEGWGYELMICRLADLIDQGRDEEAGKLARDEGASGNQWDCAKTLAEGRARHGDVFAVKCPAGIAPITGSADYSG